MIYDLDANLFNITLWSINFSSDMINLLRSGDALEIKGEETTELTQNISWEDITRCRWLGLRICLIWNANPFPFIYHLCIFTREDDFILRNYDIAVYKVGFFKIINSDANYLLFAWCLLIYINKHHVYMTKRILLTSKTGVDFPIIFRK